MDLDRADTADESPERVLVVDDVATNALLLARTLARRGLDVRAAPDGEQAIATTLVWRPDLVLLDVVMPGLDGFETCRRLKADARTRDVPIIFMSALERTSDKVRGFEAGAVDYITRPYEPLEVVARVTAHLRIRRLERRLARSNAARREANRALETKVAERSREILRSRDAVIFGLAKLAESRDRDTGLHLERICRYVEILLHAMSGSDPKIDAHFIRTVAITAALHDVGKVGVPDAVLQKEGPLTDDERAIVQRHTTIGGDTLLAIKRRWGDDPFLVTATQIAFGHHERWDGAGYPFGLAGRDIPLAARVVAVADVYDALTSRRVYKESMPHEEASRLILDESGAAFDPQVVDAFRRTEAQFRAAATELAEDAPTLADDAIGVSDRDREPWSS